MVERITFAAAEARSFKRAAIVMERVGGQSVSAKTAERVVHLDLFTSAIKSAPRPLTTSRRW